ncbi:MAG: hypothetical protein V1737_03690 [Chloroflexota bacterium]
MSEALGKIDKPLVEEFKKGKKLYFVPLVFGGKESEAEYLEKFNRYWEQIEEQIANLESKLGPVSRVYCEMISVGGEEGLKGIKNLNEKSHGVASRRLGMGAQLEVAEDDELLTEFMDWGRCLLVGLQNKRVFDTVYESYTAASRKRDEYIARHMDETLKPDETGLLFMREGHHVQFCSDIQLFYVSPPALDEINRWLRDREARVRKSEDAEHPNAEV